MNELLSKYSVIVHKKPVEFKYGREFNTELYQVYGSYSSNKVEAFEYCKRMEKDFDGWAGHIASYNKNEFTYNFLFEMNGKKYLMHINKCYNRAYPIKEEV